MEYIRDDGTSTRCPMPKQGILPHNFIHYVVEDTLNLRRGFHDILAMGVGFPKSAPPCIMQCPECSATSISKNGKQKSKQNYICKECRRQFIEDYAPPVGYSDEFKRECLKMYVNGMGFRGIERVKGVHHTTVITWVKQVGKLLPDVYQPEMIPEVGELDELQTFVDSKKKSGCGQQLTTSKKGF